MKPANGAERPSLVRATAGVAASPYQREARQEPAPVELIPALREAPHNADAEAAVIAALLADRRAIDPVIEILPTADAFHVDAHRRIYEACIELFADGVAIDLQTVADRLKARQRLHAVGGIAGLAALVDATPAVAHVADHARIVKDKAFARAIHEAAHLMAAAAFGDYGSGAAYHREALAALERIGLQFAEEDSEEGASLVELLRAEPRSAPQLPTGIATLDRVTSGGIEVGAVHVIAGHPGAGKSSLAIDLAHRFALSAAHVTILAGDQADEAYVARFGQLEGLPRGFQKMRELREAAVARLGELQIRIVDPIKHPRAFVVETASRSLRRRAGDAPGVLVVDSLQRARSRASDGVKDPRQRVDLVLDALRRAARTDGHLVLVTSEVARGSYAARDKASRTDPLAAAKESGGIEYAADLLLALDRTSDGGHVDAYLAKNRFGPDKISFALEIDTQSTRVTEVDPSDVREADDHEKWEAAAAKLRADDPLKWKRVHAEISKLLLNDADHQLRTQSRIVAGLKGKRLGHSTELIAVVKWMRARDEIYERDDGSLALRQASQGEA